MWMKIRYRVAVGDKIVHAPRLDGKAQPCVWSEGWEDPGVPDCPSLWFVLTFESDNGQPPADSVLAREFSPFANQTIAEFVDSVMNRMIEEHDDKLKTVGPFLGMAMWYGEITDSVDVESVLRKNPAAFLTLREESAVASITLVRSIFGVIRDAIFGEE